MFFGVLLTCSFKQIAPIRVVHVCDPEETAKNALDKLLNDARLEFERKHPDARQLNW